LALIGPTRSTSIEMKQKVSRRVLAVLAGADKR
jgi:hypothetical protein